MDGAAMDGAAMDGEAPPSSPDVEEVPPPARPPPVVVDLASVPTPPPPTEVETTTLAAAAEEAQLVKKEAMVEATSAWLLADRLTELKNQLQLVRMRRIFIPVRNAEGEGPAYRALDAAGFSFNFCTYTCEMTLRDVDGEEVRDENGYVTLIVDDGFSWGAHWEYPRADDDAWGEKKHWAYRIWEREAWALPTTTTRHNDPAPRVCYDPLPRHDNHAQRTPAPASRRSVTQSLPQTKPSRATVDRILMAARRGGT